MATIELEETIKREPKVDFANSGSTKLKYRKVRTLPAFFMTPGIKSEISSSSANTSSLSGSIKTEPMPIDVEENRVSTTYTLTAGKELMATRSFDIDIKPDLENEQLLETENAKNCFDGEASDLNSKNDNVNDEVSKVEYDGNSLVNERPKTPEYNSPFVGSSHSMCIADGDRDESTSSNKNRVACMYGSSCYRLNAQHKAEFSHPGDADYRRDSITDTSANKPDCQYGSQCYRKNKEHRQKFNHSSPSTGRTKRKRTVRVELQNDSDDSESLEDFSDSDEYESSFVVDDSSEGLTDSGASESEDSDLSGLSSISEDENKNNRGKKRKKRSKKK